MNIEPTWWNGDDNRDEPGVVCRECGAVVPEDEAQGARCEDCYYADPDTIAGLAAELDADEQGGK